MRALLSLATALGRAVSTQGHLNLHFAAGKRFAVRFYERPGLTCSDSELAALVSDLREVASAGQQGKPLPLYGALAGDRQDLSQRVLVIVFDRNTHKPVGFSALAYLDLRIGARQQSVLHLGLTYVDPDYQKMHLPGLLYGLAAFLLLFRGGLRGFWISNVTQVPAVVGLVASNYSDVYPDPYGRTRQSFAHLTLARQVMRHHRSVFGVADDAPFDEAHQIIQDAYTGGSDDLKKSFEMAPKYRDARVNNFCATQLDYQRGDDFLQLGRCTLLSVVKFLRGKLPQGAAVQLIYQAGALLFVALLAPVLGWLRPEPNSAQESAAEQHNYP